MAGGHAHALATSSQGFRCQINISLFLLKAELKKKKINLLWNRAGPTSDQQVAGAQSLQKTKTRKQKFRANFTILSVIPRLQKSHCFELGRFCIHCLREERQIHTRMVNDQADRLHFVSATRRLRYGYLAAVRRRPAGLEGVQGTGGAGTQRRTQK